MAQLKHYLIVKRTVITKFAWNLRSTYNDEE